MGKPTLTFTGWGSGDLDILVTYKVKGDSGAFLFDELYVKKVETGMMKLFGESLGLASVTVRYIQG